MNNYFIITWTDIDLENGAEELIASLLKIYSSFTEKELVIQAKKLIPMDDQNFAQRNNLYISNELLPMSPGEVIVFKEQSINYHKLLVAVVSILDLITEETERVKFIMGVGRYLEVFDKNIFGKFKSDIAEDVYYSYK
ncbi:hypothetical protein [Halobacillus seohaensis]|uniref:Uncharacterized protein n=1 Tax=Halobacillus seohaensis TaxID=447421 RepID=A0ABW2ENE4_9BACI